MNPLSYFQKVAEVACDNGDVAKAICDVSLNATQQLLALNGDFVRTLACANVPAAQPNLHDQTTLYAQGFERASEYFRNVTELCAKTHAEIATVNAQRAAEITHALAAQVDDLFQGSPFKSAGIPDMLKSTLNSAGAACQNMIHVSREVAESTVAATAQALQNSADASRTSARSVRKTA